MPSPTWAFLFIFLWEMQNESKARECLCTKSLCFFSNSCLEMTGCTCFKVCVGAQKTRNLLIASQTDLALKCFSVRVSGLVDFLSG